MKKFVQNFIYWKRMGATWRRAWQLASRTI